jgi:hypothetical protein
MTHLPFPQTDEEKQSLVKRMYECGFLSRADYEKYTYKEIIDGQ